MKINKSFLWFGIALILLSVASAVYGYELDNARYRLDIAGVTVESEDSIRFYMINPSSESFDLSELYTYSVKMDGLKSEGRFSRSIDEPLPMIGTLGFGDKKLVRLPGESLKCGWPVTIELNTFKGKLTARYVGIPACEITAPRRHGLTKIDYCTAEFYDGTLEMKWELLDADQFKSQVKLRKTSGKLAPVEAWYDMGLCPDLEGGKCMTEIEYILFNEEGVFVKLNDMREGTSVVLSSTEDRPCITRHQQITVAIAPEQKAEDIGTPAPAEPAHTETYLLDANKQNDVRVCLQGCKAESNCYDEGTRARYLGKDVYCKGQGWLVQKKDGKTCTDSWECESELCHNGSCVAEEPEDSGESWVTRLLKWIDNLI
ncbi:hypothetical protein KY359_06365 [Candidatus Woesearchaeota archaeon]|nr:hypothetical protein [Candidatus Woesearchaeota archaeon]